MASFNREQNPIDPMSYTVGGDNPDIADTHTTRGLFGGELDPTQAASILDSLKKGAPDRAAYDTSGLAKYEDYFSKAGDTTDARMQEVLDLARNSALGRGPSVAQKQSDLGVAQAAANARSLAAGARGGGVGAFQAMKAGSAAAGQAAGQAAIARAAEQTGALQEYGKLSAADVEQRRSAKSSAAKLQAGAMATKQAYDQALTQYNTNYANTLHALDSEMNGNTPSGLQSNQQQAQAIGAGISAIGAILAAL